MRIYDRYSAEANILIIHQRPTDIRRTELSTQIDTVGGTIFRNTKSYNTITINTTWACPYQHVHYDTQQAPGPDPQPLDLVDNTACQQAPTPNLAGTVSHPDRE